MDYDRILLDINTQHDFFRPGGSCYTPAASAAAGNIYRLFHWAKAENIPVMSTILRVRPREIGPLAPVPHCMDGSQGERKLRRTILRRRINFGLLNSTDLPEDLFEHYQQVIFEMRHTDVLQQARAERLITELDAGTFIICGAGVAHGILEAAIGLRKRRFAVIVARDAVVAVDPAAPAACERMAAKGVILASAAEIVAPRPARPRAPFRLRLPV